MGSCANNAPAAAESRISGNVNTEVNVVSAPVLPKNTVVKFQNLTLEQAKSQDLSRGSYKINAVIEYTGSPVFITNEEKGLNVGEEIKRVFYHKIEIKNIRTEGGRRVADLITKFTVVDNPLPLVPIIWGASIVASGTAGWFFLDKAQEFTETTGGKLITVLAAGLSAFVIFKNL